VGKQYKILLVDDNPDILEITKEELLACNYEVITAANGVEGLRKAEREHPDLIILDIMLPGLDGYEVCHRLRSKSRTAEVPILMYSAKVRDVDRETGLRVGADDYLTKSVDSSADLVRRVEVLLARKAEKEAAAAGKPREAISVEAGVGATTEGKEVPERTGVTDEKEPEPSVGVVDKGDTEERQRSRLSPKPRL
jgi:DNA-binding response OmpR family regulator